MRHSALVRYAAARPKDPNGALALFSLGVTETGLGVDKHPDAIQHLKAARGRLPKLADYVGYELALAESDLKQVSGDLFPVWNNTPPSPLAVKGALVAANAYNEIGNATAAIEMLRRFYSQLPQPEGDFSLASSYEAAHDLASAAVYYQRVYYQHPASSQAATAATALARIRQSLGAAYPPATASMMLDRAAKWLAAGYPSKARQEYDSLDTQLAGADRDLALVGIGAADYAAGNTAAAARYLKSLQVSSREADAQRLYQLAECARRMDSDDQLNSLIGQLGRLYPDSAWRLRALVSAGNHYVMSNQAQQYLPLFRTAYEAFPSDPLADYCHWKVTWSAYLNRRPEAAEMLREQLSRFPSSSYAAASLYFLGRLFETNRDLAAAKACYQKIAAAFRSFYYCGLAEERLREPALSDVSAPSQVLDFLNGLPLRTPPAAVSFEPNVISRLRIERARLLASAALDDLADEELRFGATTGDQPHVLAMEMAELAARRGAPDRAIRVIKKYVPDYFATAFDSAPRQFWELAFPLPYRASLLRYAQQHNLDPYLVAGLVRQESEFNPKAVSPAKAYGLTQVLPSTGRQLSRKLGVKGFRTAALLQPDTNLRLGTYYLKSLLDSHSGKLAPTLASYNAGGSRVASWLNWADFREPAEFVETIPISETRNYVQSVLRNAFAYRHLYGPEPPKAPPPEKVVPKKPAAPRKKTSSRPKR